MASYSRSLHNCLFGDANQYIKQDPDIKDEPDFDPGSPVLVHGRLAASTLRSNTGGFLSARSAEIQAEKRKDPYSDDLATIFETDGMLAARDKGICVHITNILLDTGASHCFVSARVARTAGLRKRAVQSKRFITCNGPVWHDKMVDLHLFIAGVEANVSAYINEGLSCHSMILGMSAVGPFGINFRGRLGRRREKRWTVSPDITGLRRRQYVLQEVWRNNYISDIHNYSDGLIIARQPGETIKESNSRGVIERAAAKYRTAVQKHGQRVKKELRDDYCW